MNSAIHLMREGARACAEIERVYIAADILSSCRLGSVDDKRVRAIVRQLRAIGVRQLLRMDRSHEAAERVAKGAAS